MEVIPKRMVVKGFMCNLIEMDLINGLFEFPIVRSENLSEIKIGSFVTV